MILVSVGPTAGALAAPTVARDLAAAGHRVQVTLEPGTEHFVGPGSFAPFSEVVENPSGAPDAVLCLPATAGTLARLARGLDHPAAVARSGGAPLFLAPYLDAATARNPAVRSNLEALRGEGARIILDEEGGAAGVDEVVA